MTSASQGKFVVLLEEQCVTYKGRGHRYNEARRTGEEFMVLPDKPIMLQIGNNIHEYFLIGRNFARMYNLSASTKEKKIISS